MNGRERPEISNEVFARYVDDLYRRSNGKFPGLREISKYFGQLKSWNVYSVFRLGLAHRIFGHEVVNLIERARTYLKEEEENPEPWLIAG